MSSKDQKPRLPDKELDAKRNPSATAPRDRVNDDLSDQMNKLTIATKNNPPERVQRPAPRGGRPKKTKKNIKLLR